MRAFWYKKLVILVFLFFASLEAEDIESNVQLRQNRDEMTKNTDIKTDTIILNKNKKAIENLPRLSAETIETINKDSSTKEQKEKKEQDWNDYTKNLQEENRNNKKLAKQTIKELKNELIKEKKLRRSQAKLDKIERKDYRRLLFEKGIFSIPMPFFYTYFGLGFANTHVSLSSSAIPNFNIGFGFNQQINLWYLYLGFRLNMGYEVAIKAAGENTNVYQLLGFYTSAYIGFYRFNVHLDLGYEMFGHAMRFGDALSNADGFSVGAGVGFVLSKHGGLDFNFKLMTGTLPNVNNIENITTGVLYSRVMLNYEFRF